ncbi:MAG: hypothetical protein IJA31_07530 [Clostridia bacterium]|nr:hypothetical protein [Clostridia bacterium]
MRPLKKDSNKVEERKFIAITVALWVIVLILVPVLLNITCIKQLFLYLISFTNSADYKIAYVEFWGTIIGSFIAIWGALYVQRKIDKNSEHSNQVKYAYVVYYDLRFALKDLNDICDEAINKNNNFVKQLDVYNFYQSAKGRKIHLNPKWIADVAQLNGVFSDDEIEQIYTYYGKLVDIDRAFQSESLEKIEKAFTCVKQDFRADSIEGDYEKYIDVLDKLHQFITQNKSDEKYQQF